MKILHCPLNGPRNIQEFVYGGEVATMPDQDAGSDSEWTEYVFLETNRAGLVREWWLHVASGYWFIAERDTSTDEVLRTYPPDKAFAGGGTARNPARGS